MSENNPRPVVMFTLAEAIEHYKGDPIVRCLADDDEVQIQSSTIHSERYMQYPEPWIWAYPVGDQVRSILLYAPGQFNLKECIKAEIVEVCS